jgi:hypothetical protein
MPITAQTTRHFPKLIGTIAILGVLPAEALAADEASSFLGEVIGNATYRSQVVFNAFPRAADGASSKGIEHDPLEAWTHLGIDSKTFIGDNWAFDLGVEAIASTHHDAEKGAFTAPSSRSGQGKYIDISRLTLSYLGDEVEMLVGKDSLPVGVAEIYSPADLYGRSNTANPQQAVDFGVWQLRTDVFIGSGQLTAVILPVQEAAPGTSDRSRWSGGSGSSGNEFSSITIPGLAVGLTPDIQDDVRGSGPGEWGYFLKYGGTATGMDYFVTAYNGPGAYPVLKLPIPGNFNPYYKVYPRVTILSAGVAVTEGPWKLYGEAVETLASGDRDEDTARVLLGAKYRETTLANRLGLDEITPIAEYAKEWRQDEQTSPFYVMPSKTARPNRNNMLLSVNFKVDDTWKFGGVYNRAFDTRDAATSAYVQYNPNDNLWYRLSGSEYHGRDHTSFGRYSRNDNIEFEVNYSF